MSQPDPTPAAPAPAPTTTPAVPAPTPTPAAPAWNPDTLPPEAKTWLQQQVAQAQADADRKSRVGSKENAEKGVIDRIAQALGLTPAAGQAGTPTVESLAQQLGEIQAKAEEAQVIADITTIANGLGANVAAVLDSKRLANQINAVEAPDVDAWTAAVKKIITDAVAANPALKAQEGTGPVRQGADHTGGGTGRTRSTSLDAAVAKALGG